MSGGLYPISYNRDLRHTSELYTYTHLVSVSDGWAFPGIDALDPSGNTSHARCFMMLVKNQPQLMCNRVTYVVELLGYSLRSWTVFLGPETLDVCG